MVRLDLRDHPATRALMDRRDRMDSPDSPAEMSHAPDLLMCASTAPMGHSDHLALMDVLARGV